LYVLKEKSKIQPSQDNCEDMVKKLEKGSTVASSTSQQHTKTHKNKIQEKSKIGHIKFQHRPTKHKAQESPQEVLKIKHVESVLQGQKKS
jgi:hypothetical protein